MVMLKIMVRTCCICVGSLVVRVISEAVLNVSNSCSEKPETCAKTRVRRFLPKPVETRDDSSTASTEQTAPPAATKGRKKPFVLDPLLD